MATSLSECLNVTVVTYLDNTAGTTDMFLQNNCIALTYFKPLALVYVNTNPKSDKRNLEINQDNKDCSLALTLWGYEDTLTQANGMTLV